MTETDLHKRFRKGLIEMGHDPDTIKETWRYAGGDTDKRYYEKFWGHTNLFPLKDTCICKQKIKHNFYIASPNKSEYLVIGSCCIRKFIKHRTRTCDICFQKHRNRKDNLCDNCRHQDRNEMLNMMKEDMLLYNDNRFSFQEGDIEYSSSYRNLFLQIEKANRTDTEKEAMKQYFLTTLTGRTISHYLFLRLK